MGTTKERENAVSGIILIMLMTWLYLAGVVWALPVNGIALHFEVEGAPVEGVGFSCYRIGDQVDADTAADLKELATGLSEEISAEPRKPDGNGLTDRNGNLSITGLDKGVYLVVGENLVFDDASIRPEPFLISAAEEMTQVAEVKYEKMMDTHVPVDPGEKLPQTGLLWGSVSALVCAGFFFIISGKIIRKSEEIEHTTDEK